jgi:hypothetical protein
MVFLLGSIGRLGTRYQQAGQPIPPFLGLLELTALAFAVWLVWGFIRMRTLERWLCAFLFAYWAISATWGIARVLLKADSESIRGTVAVAVIWLIVFIPNLASIIYLFTRPFREFALRYAEEKHREEMRRYAQKQSEKGSKS